MPKTYSQFRELRVLSPQKSFQLQLAGRREVHDRSRLTEGAIGASGFDLLIPATLDDVSLLRVRDRAVHYLQLLRLQASRKDSPVTRRHLLLARLISQNPMHTN